MKEPSCQVCGSPHIYNEDDMHVFCIFPSGNSQGMPIDLCEKHYKELCKFLRMDQL